MLQAQAGRSAPRPLPVAGAPIGQVLGVFFIDGGHPYAASAERTARGVLGNKGRRTRSGHMVLVSTGVTRRSAPGQAPIDAQRVAWPHLDPKPSEIIDKLTFLRFWDAQRAQSRYAGPMRAGRPRNHWEIRVNVYVAGDKIAVCIGQLRPRLYHTNLQNDVDGVNPHVVPDGAQ